MSLKRLALVALCFVVLVALPYVIVGIASAKDSAGMCAVTPASTTATLGSQAILEGGSTISLSFAVTTTETIDHASVHYGVYYLGPQKRTIFDFDAPGQQREITTTVANTPPVMLIGEGFAVRNAHFASGNPQLVSASWVLPSNAPQGIYEIVPTLSDVIGNPIENTSTSAPSSVTKTDGPLPPVLATRELAPDQQTDPTQDLASPAYTTLLQNLTTSDVSVDLAWKLYDGEGGTALEPRETHAATLKIPASQSMLASQSVPVSVYDTSSVVEVQVSAPELVPFKLHQAFAGTAPLLIETPVRRVSSLHLGPWTLNRVSLCTFTRITSPKLSVKMSMRTSDHSASITKPQQQVSFWQWAPSNLAQSDLTITLTDATRSYQQVTSKLCGTDNLLCGGKQ